MGEKQLRIRYDKIDGFIKIHSKISISIRYLDISYLDI